jgi:Cu/Ag efflux pump CusA
VPLAIAIVYGLAFSTLLTLFVTPAMLAIEHRYWADGKFGERMASLWQRIVALLARFGLIKRKSTPDAAE